jgi:hypothetical protein
MHGDGGDASADNDDCDDEDTDGNSTRSPHRIKWVPPKIWQATFYSQRARA